MTRRHHTAGNARPWQFSRRTLDASLRYQMHGPILPMEGERTGLWARVLAARVSRLFGARR